MTRKRHKYKRAQKWGLNYEGECDIICARMMDLNELREKIDVVDARIVELLKERAACVHAVGELKKANGAPVFVPERESSLINKLMKLNNGVLPEKGLLSIYRQIVSCSFSMEGGIRVGYLGPEGTWSHQAAMARFGDSVELIAYPTFQDVFDAVERGKVEYGVIPIENSTDGKVSQAVDLMGKTSLRICAQIHQSVQNCLMSNIPMEDIKVIYSHPQVLGQCRDWLLVHFPQASLVPTSSTTVAAQYAVTHASEGAAALGSQMAAELHGLKLLAINIQDKATNTTRFAVIGQQSTKPSVKDRTTICFGVPNVAGSLVDVLAVFKTHGINIHCMDSRPSRDTAWEYVFYIDVEGHEAQEPLKSCLEELHGNTPMLKVLGSYPEN